MQDDGNRSEIRTMLLSVSWSSAGSPPVGILCVGRADGAGLSKCAMSLHDKPWTKAG